ncbi:MAG: NADH-dependent butanol dehydrogenase B [Syntrophaceae bacterium PtaB.Bin038]|nr:MAG: NADH-dependent butanol dehydrogenase B [Syntrophaceae bacterium PtaB.Bin038]
MQNFVFENPTKIIFGKGSIARIGAEVKRFGTRVLMVYGMGSVRASGVYEQVLNSLKEAGVDVVELPGVKSNPLLSRAKEGIALARSNQVDAVLAVGGGSVIDTAKTIAAGAMADHDPWEFFVYTKTVKSALPVLVVLTLSASASEMNAAAVITRDDTLQKFSVRSPLIQPKTSILDPEALYTVTPSYTAYSAVDIITHMLEGYFTNTEPGESPLQDRMVYAFMRTLMEATEKSLANPRDYDARANFMWSGTLAFNGLTTAGMGVVGFPVHMIEHSLSALYDIAHGAGLSIVLPGWMSWSSAKRPARFARLAREFFGVDRSDDARAAVEGINRLTAWFRSIKSPVTLKEGGIPEGDIERIADNAVELAKTWKLKDYTKEVIVEVLQHCR